MKHTIFLFALLLFVFSLNACQKKSSKKVFNFYHWKSRAKLTETDKATLDSIQTETIYLHYFDVEKTSNNDYYSKGVYPVNTLREIDEATKQYQIVPVVYITQKTLKSLGEDDLDRLATQIHELVNQIHQKHFGENPTELQLDCDWTEQTRDKFWQIIEQLSAFYDISCTIRLHQIKYAEKTGVPPVKKGILMAYNVGDLKNFEQNSILEADIVRQYINSKTSYPLELDIALPLYSQMVIKNNQNEVRLINQNKKQEMLDSPTHFKQLDEHVFEVTTDTLFRGFYLKKGFQLKIENSMSEEIIETHKIIKNSQLKTSDEIIFYHLDEQTLQTAELNDLINAL